MVLDSDFRIERFRKEYSEAVRDVALHSWLSTYSDIYTENYIRSFIDRYYRIEAIAGLEDYVRRDEIFFAVSVTGNDITGFCQINRADDRYLLSRIYILPEHLHKGTGTKFLELGEKWIRKHGGSCYHAYVNGLNHPAVRFYEKSGFERSSDPEEGDELRYFKRLDL